MEEMSTPALILRLSLWFTVEVRQFSSALLRPTRVENHVNKHQWLLVLCHKLNQYKQSVNKKNQNQTDIRIEMWWNVHSSIIHDPQTNDHLRTQSPAPHPPPETKTSPLLVALTHCCEVRGRTKSGETVCGGRPYRGGFASGDQHADV